MKKQYTIEESRYIEEHIKKDLMRNIAKHLNRSLVSVKSHIARNGNKSNYSTQRYIENYRGKRMRLTDKKPEFDFIEVAEKNGLEDRILALEMAVQILTETINKLVGHET